MDPERRFDGTLGLSSFGPRIEEIRTLDGGVYQKIISPSGEITAHEIKSPYIYSDPMWSGYSSTLTGKAYTTTAGLSMADYNELKKLFEKEEDSKVNVFRKKSYNSGEHIVACNDENDLSIENILKTLSAVKGKLMLDIAPIHVKNIECSITPVVRKNIVMASKRLKMYGKKRPIIARFDEYGNRLPDEIDLGTDQGITLKIVDPKEFGEFYFELKGIEFPSGDYYSGTLTDLPF